LPGAENTDGEPGEERTLRLEQKLVADGGLVGFPNAGKSSLISAISDAHPRIEAYPFTTLNPIIGTIIFDDFSRLRVADIPGIIEGAHDGVGLGHDFLRHIERCRFLLFVIDMAGVDQREPWDDYEQLRKEISLHREEIATRTFVVVANKMDLPEAQDNLATFKRRTGQDPIPVSAQAGTGLDELKQAILRLSSTS
jgi:GTP-binding protein